MRGRDTEPWRMTTTFLGCVWRVVLAGFCLPAAWAQPHIRSADIADAAMRRWPVEKLGGSADYGPGQPGINLLLHALNEEWFATANPGYFNYARSVADSLIGPESGGFAGKPAPNPAVGRELLLLYRVTRQERYWKQASALRDNLLSTQRAAGTETRQDVYEAGPFLAEYASVFAQQADFAAIAQRFSRADRPVREPRTAPHATAWRLVLLVDALPFYPRSDPGRAMLLGLLRRKAKQAQAEQRSSPAEASTALLVAYALAKAARLGYLPPGYTAAAEQIFGHASAGQAGPPSFADDPALAGAMLLAARELEVAPLARLGRGRTALVDAWFNSQQRKNAAGETESFHYKWNDYSDSGFSLLGHLFNDYGVETRSLDAAPTSANLKLAQLYLIVSPDISVKNPHPHYATEQDAGQVAAWVKQGGILLLFENDPDNADIDHLNLIADVFGLHFNKVLSHHVEGDTYSMGRIDVAGGGEFFKQPHVLYMKDTCTLRLSGPARPVLADKGDVMMATARYGKGTVFAVVDPWLYNEYTDGRKLPADYDNFAGAQELLAWLMRQPQGQ